MKKKILPLIVSTMEALEGIAGQDVPVIYVENPLYTAQPFKIRQLLGERGYRLRDDPGIRGVFFLRTGGEHAFRKDLHEIHDPLHIL